MMHSPPHPGEFIKQTCLEPLNLTVTVAAKHLGVTRQTLSRLINGECGISPNMAVRLSKAFGRDAEVWLRQQMHYDLSRAKIRMKDVNVKALFPVTS